MKRLVFAVAALASLPAFLPAAGNSAGPFDSKLSQDRQIVHVLNRLTFGPHPGDAEEVRSIGVEKWIDLQLHPDRIPEDPQLETRLKSFETLRMNTASIRLSGNTARARHAVYPGHRTSFSGSGADGFQRIA